MLPSSLGFWKPSTNIYLVNKTKTTLYMDNEIDSRQMYSMLSDALLWKA